VAIFFGVISVTESRHTGMEVFLKGMSFHGVMLDEVISGAPGPKKIVHDMITQGISAGVVQPLPRTVFPDTQVEQAFRYSCDGGKLVGGWSRS
jgi:fatty acid synthase